MDELMKFGANDRDIKRIDKWLGKISSEDFMKVFREKYKEAKDAGKTERDLFNQARRSARYPFASELQSRSTQHTFLVISASSPRMTQFASQQLSDETRSNLAPGTMPDIETKDEKGGQRAIWSRSHVIMPKDSDDKYLDSPITLMQYDENVTVPLEVGSLYSCNVNVSPKTGDFNWARDSVKSLKVLESDVDISKFIDTVNGLIYYDSGKYTTKNTRRLNILINKSNDWQSPEWEKSIIWQGDDFCMKSGPTLVPISFMGFSKADGSYSDISSFKANGSTLDPQSLHSVIPVFDDYETVVEWFDNLVDKPTRSIGGKDTVIAEEVIEGSARGIPVHCILFGKVMNMNLIPHERTGNGWILIDVEGDELNNPVMCFLSPQVVEATDEIFGTKLKIEDEVYVTVQLNKRVEDNQFTANAGAVTLANTQIPESSASATASAPESAPKQAPKSAPKPAKPASDTPAPASTDAKGEEEFPDF